MKRTARKGLPKKFLTGSEIESIIQSCAKANVRVLEIHGIRLEFGAGVPSSPPQPAQVSSEPAPSEAAISEKHEKQSQEALEQDELRLRRDQLALMLIENPVEYEKLVASGELEEMELADGEDDERSLDD